VVESYGGGGVDCDGGVEERASDPELGVNSGALGQDSQRGVGGWSVGSLVGRGWLRVALERASIIWCGRYDVDRASPAAHVHLLAQVGK
jgi:hypothetical protein